jgi:hypothetical protein
VVDTYGVIGRLVVTKVALETPTFEAIRAYFLYYTVDNFRIWLVVHRTPFSILINMLTVLIKMVLAAYTSWRLPARVLAS